MSRFVSIFVLLLLFIELCDPSTPFIRVAHKPIGSQNAVATSQKRTAAIRLAAAIELRKAERHSEFEVSPLQGVGDIHAATLAGFFYFELEQVPSVVDVRDTSFHPQYDPREHKRPPISA